MNIAHLMWDDCIRAEQVALACFRDDGDAIGNTLIDAYKANGFVGIVRLVDALGCMAAWHILCGFGHNEDRASAYIESQMDKAICYAIEDVSGDDQ